MPDDVVNEFRTDEHRRVCGMLQEPTSAPELLQAAQRHDPVNLRRMIAGGVARVERIIDELGEDGLVKALGSHGSDSPDDAATAALAAMKDDDDVPSVPGPVAASWRRRARRSGVSPNPHHGDKLYGWTKAGKARLTAPVPTDTGEPMEGERLRGALREDAAWAEREQDIIGEERERSRPMEHPSLTEAADKDAARRLAELDDIIAKGKAA